MRAPLSLCVRKGVRDVIIVVMSWAVSEGEGEGEGAHSCHDLGENDRQVHEQGCCCCRVRVGEMLLLLHHGSLVRECA